MTKYDFGLFSLSMSTFCLCLKLSLLDLENDKIKITNSTAYSLITSSKAASKQEKLSDAVESFLITYKVKDHEKNAIRLRFTRMIASRPKNNYNDAKVQQTLLSTQVTNIKRFAEENNITREEALERIVEECKRKWQMSLKNQL